MIDDDENWVELLSDSLFMLCPLFMKSEEMNLHILHTQETSGKLKARDWGNSGAVASSEANGYVADDTDLILFTS